MPDLSEKIKAARNAKGLSQREFADLIGVSQAVAHQWESGKSVPRPKNLNKIRDLLGISASAFLADLDTVAESAPDYRKEKPSKVRQAELRLQEAIQKLFEAQQALREAQEDG